MIADQFILVYIGISQRAKGGEKTKQLTTAVARSAPREVQLKTSVSTPNTIILQGGEHKATAMSECNSVQKIIELNEVKPQQPRGGEVKTSVLC